MKYTKEQKETIKELLDNSDNYIEAPLYGEDKPYYNLNKARNFLKQYRNAKFSLKQSDALIQLYQQDINRLSDEELQQLLSEYQTKEKDGQKQYIKAQQNVISVINSIESPEYKLLLTNYYLNEIPIEKLATEWKLAGSSQKGCTLSNIKYLLAQALKEICKVLQKEG